MTYQTLSVSCLALFGAVACFPQTPVPLNPIPSRIVGHPNPEQNILASASPNLVEGRELFAPQGIALDTSVSPNSLYVSDTGNNRVLAWKNAAGFTNGQKADMVIGQVDFFSTLPQGPGRTFQAGLSAPSGLAVSGGDLYIADSGNNRVLRFRKPFQNAGNLFPDLYIGQPNLSSRAINNNGTGQVGAQGLNFVFNNAFQTVGLAFDTAGNLWITDPGNSRVLRFAASDLAAGGTSGPGGPLTANLLIGNLGVFTSVSSQQVTAANAATITNLFAAPAAIAFDPAGRLFISDSDNATFARVLVFLPPFSNSSSAARIMGEFPPNLTQPPSQDVIAKTVFSCVTNACLGGVNSIFFIPGSSPKVGLLDQGGSRIVLFDSYDNWPDPATSYSPQATAVIGQASFTGRNFNGGTTFNPAASTTSLYLPAAAVFSGSDLYVADTGNHRVLDLPLQGSTFGPATRVLGQDHFDMRAPNLIEGKEFDFTTSTAAGLAVEGGVAIDSSGDTPHLYVADFFNNRVLGFKDFRNLTANSKADIVIGQPDFNSGLCNVTGDPNHITSTTLCAPAGILTDSNGNLYVADSGNGRVVRFPAPFSHQTLEQADLVLGQHNLTSKLTDPTPFTMAAPYGLAFAGTNGLLVSDSVHNRVLFFPFTNGTFDPNVDSGRAATKVLGQPDFNTVTSGTTDAKMSSPRHISTDTDGRPYVVDPGNGRVLIFDGIATTPSGASASHIITNLASPRGIFVNAATGEIWVTNTNNFTVQKYPKYQSLLFNDAPIASVQSAGAPIAVTQDQYGDLIVAESSNRVSFYFPGLQAMNAGNFLPSYHLAPGMLAAICAKDSNCDVNKPAVFGANTVIFTDLANPLPLPTSLDNIQVRFITQDSSGNLVTQATPMYFVSPGQINFYVPMGAPTSGTVNMEVVQTTTGRVYAAGPVTMSTYSPAVLATFVGKFRQASVLNQDNTINSPTNPALRGSTISIYAVGQGFVPNAPPDGSPPTDASAVTPFTPRVAFNGLFTDEYTPGTGDPADKTKFVSFSGLAPGLVGIWQVNVQIPQNVDPAGGAKFGCSTPGCAVLIVQAGSLNSVDSTAGFVTTIAVK